MHHAAAITACAVALGLSACNSEPEISATNASVEEVATKVRDAGSGTSAGFIRAGKWSSKVTMEDVTMPGMPPELAARMKSSIGGDKSYESCLTEEQAKRPTEDFFAGKNNQCRYDHFTMGDGKIDAKMRCAQGDMSQVMEMAGTYAPDSYRMRMSTVTEGAGGAAEGMSMKMRVEARRVGACDGKEA